MTLAERYAKLCATPSSINEHLPTLRSYAERCESVAEFGVDIGQSTTALLMGHPETLWSIDIVPCPAVHELAEAADSFERFEWRYIKAKFGKTEWNFWVADSRKFDLADVDLLFIDSAHSYDQLIAELTRHHAQVRRWIALHDTESFGTYGEAGPPQLGLTPAIEEFLAHHPEWVILERFTHNNGLLILERQCP